MNGRRTPEEVQADAANKKEKARVDQDQRQDERDGIANRLIGVVDSLRKDPNYDARQAHRIEINFDDKGNAVVIAHSRVFPTYEHVVSSATIDATALAVQ